MNSYTLDDLAWAIAADRGQFSLIFARCNYVKLRDQLIEELSQQLSESDRVVILELEQRDLNLYYKIQERIEETVPDVLMVYGFEKVGNIPEFLAATNNQREKFRQDLKFPVILWVSDRAIAHFEEFAQDFHNWGVTLSLPISVEALKVDLQDKIDTLFAGILEAGGLRFISNEEILGTSYEQEIQGIQAELDQFGEGVSSEIQGCLEFIQGRHAYFNQDIEGAIGHYQETQEIWQSCTEFDPIKQAVLEFNLGLCFGEKPAREDTEKAKTHLETCLDILGSQKRHDLRAKFLNNLGEVLLKLEDWSGLKELAEEGIKVHQEYRHSLELSQTYGFLAQLALKEEHWQLACDNANLGLSRGNAPVLAPNVVAPMLAFNVVDPNALLYLLLAQGQEQLGQHEESWKNCQAGLEFEIDRNIDYFLKLLQELRDLYFKQSYYLDAYKTKLEIQARKQQYGLTAFVGAGRLKASKNQDIALFGGQKMWRI